MIKSIVNLRRIGNGDRTRTLFRSGDISLVSWSEAFDLSRELGVQRFIDLRTPTELVRSDVTPDLLKAGIQRLQFPMNGADVEFRQIDRPQAADYAALYLRILRQQRSTISAIVRTLALSVSVPTLIGCTAGKDRTGVVAAVLLGLLGATDNEITQDYIAGNELLASASERFEAHWTTKRISRTTYMQRLVCQESSMRQICEGVKGEFGSWEGLVDKTFGSHLAAELRNRFATNDLHHQK